MSGWTRVKGVIDCRLFVLQKTNPKKFIYDDICVSTETVAQQMAGGSASAPVIQVYAHDLVVDTVTVTPKRGGCAPSVMTYREVRDILEAEAENPPAQKFLNKNKLDIAMYSEVTIMEPALRKYSSCIVHICMPAYACQAGL
jgi:hypothetical protein